MDKEDEEYTHTHRNIVQSLKKKKNKIFSFATWMELDGIMLNEISQTQDDTDCVISLTCSS